MFIRRNKNATATKPHSFLPNLFRKYPQPSTEDPSRVSSLVQPKRKFSQGFSAKLHLPKSAKSASLSTRASISKIVKTCRRIFSRGSEDSGYGSISENVDNSVSNQAPKLPTLRYHDSSLGPSKQYEYEDIVPDGEHDRRDFPAIRAMHSSKIAAAVLEVLNLDADATCEVIDRKEGSYHHVVMLAIREPERDVRELVLRIPSHGTADNWESIDGYHLENEAVNMLYIRKKTSIPIPEVLSFDSSVTNAIGAPYILMTRMPGIPAHDMWLGKPMMDVEAADRHIESECPSEELEEKRNTFLRSLAQTMAQLDQVTFKKIGVPTYYRLELNVIICWGFAGPFRWHTPEKMFKSYTIGPFKSSVEYYNSRLDMICDPEDFFNEDDKDDEYYQYALGLRKVVDMIVSALPSPPPNMLNPDTGKPQAETFVLRHNDLDTQSILVDDNGSVAGIIDWDGLMTVPRCFGPTAFPLFLRRDVLPDFSLSQAPFLLFSLPKYREVFAEEMEKHTDARYTRKSLWFEAVHAMLYEDTEPKQLVQMLMHEID
ncbi:hypothetical protein CC80DRAFT_564798 [Byssothecium circinans]|uniref:Aminoglycoside phosphotransferase domain-containing protein n=1 Tax=Byssothecium circinans TaxID=147558 RepID=A0A6A5TU84_9PLEO|nr:hypothetical protein CC80DRAFT_564798 [Byssothecium circinans]